MTGNYKNWVSISWNYVELDSNPVKGLLHYFAMLYFPWVLNNCQFTQWLLWCNDVTNRTHGCSKDSYKGHKQDTNIFCHLTKISGSWYFTFDPVMQSNTRSEREEFNPLYVREFVITNYFSQKELFWICFRI